MHKLIFLDRIGDTTHLTNTCKAALLQAASVGKLDEDAVFERLPVGAPSLLLITSGIGRVFIETNDGRDVTQHFLRAEDFVIANLSDERQVREQVQAITDMSYVSVPLDTIESLLVEYPSMALFLAAYYNERSLRMRDRAGRFSRSGAVDTYESFLRTHPGLETQVPTIHLASYLGLTTSEFMRARQKYRQRGIM